MRPLRALSVLLLPACGVFAPGGPLEETPIYVRSHNRSEVDVYLLCGNREAQWLGSVPPHGDAAYAIAPARRVCAPGLNFFLVSRDRGQGYWVGPLRPRASSAVTLVIEKYAGLSSGSVR